MKVQGLSIVLLAIAVSRPTNAFECAVSLPEIGDLPDTMQEADGNFVWVGNGKLAARVPRDGLWTAMGPQYNYRDKWWWWKEEYRAKVDAPNLVITATRLDQPSQVVVRNATNAYGPGWDAMLVGMEFPSPGCWEVVGRYHDEELRFVFKVGN